MLKHVNRISIYLCKSNTTVLLNAESLKYSTNSECVLYLNLYLFCNIYTYLLFVTVTFLSSREPHPKSELGAVFILLGHIPTLLLLNLRMSFLYFALTFDFFVG